MAFFEEVAFQRDQPDGHSPPIGSIKYVDMPAFFWWNLKKWIRRTNNRVQVPRLEWIHPNYREAFFLRMLLQHVRGPSSFAACRTINGAFHCKLFGLGRLYATFEEAARAAGLCEDDKEAMRCMEEAAAFKKPGPLRELYAYLISRCSSDPVALYRRFEKVRHFFAKV